MYLKDSVLGKQEYGIIKWVLSVIYRPKGVELTIV